jgi:DNA-binding protein YbaB
LSEVDRRNVEMLRDEYERQVTNLGEMHRRLKEISATAVSPRRELSVTVGNQGVITEVKFLTSVYRRLAKNELSELVMRTITEAREKAIEQTAEVMAPMLPPGLNAKDLLTGAADVAQLAPDESRLPPLLRERLNRQV